MADGDETTCKACGRGIVQLRGGHRQRQYCDENCRQAAFRRRQEAKHREEVYQRWAVYTPETQVYLDWLMTRYGEDLANDVAVVMAREIAAHQQRITSSKERVAALEQELARIQAQIVNERRHPPGTDEQVMELARRRGFPEWSFSAFGDHIGKIRTGETYWQHFCTVAEMRLVRAVLASLKRDVPDEQR